MRYPGVVAVAFRAHICEYGVLREFIFVIQSSRKDRLRIHSAIDFAPVSDEHNYDFLIFQIENSPIVSDSKTILTNLPVN